MLYFSEREEGERPRNNEEISRLVWEGVQALMNARVVDGSFGATYPENCPDGSMPTGTNEDAFNQAMRAEIPELQKQPNADPARALMILDVIEFCWLHIGKPITGGYHDYFKHNHLTFDVEVGREMFREAINRIFRRNGIVYELKGDGHIERLGPTVLHEELISAHFSTGDSELNNMLETARRKFLDKNEATRREALKDLWGAWERLKTLGEGQNKKAQVTYLLDTTAGLSSPVFRNVLEKDAEKLTEIGNRLFIRHFETSQERIAKHEHVDYLFHRLFALVQVILRTNPAVC